jgi:hypothetical protein
MTTDDTQQRPPWKVAKSPRFSEEEIKAATRFWPLFPVVSERFSSFRRTFSPACMANPEHKANLEAEYHQHQLEFWQGLAAVYVAALQEPDDTDQPAPLQVVVESWPEGEAAQQAALTVLLAESSLCSAWDEQQRFYHLPHSGYSEQRRAEEEVLEQAHVIGSRPLAEIPLYYGWGRSSCQQLVCLPLPQWQALFDSTAHYEPASVDRRTVERLATRIARAFNVPPQDHEQLLDALAFIPTVWKISLRGLTDSLDSHGMSDICTGAVQQAKEGEFVPMSERRYLGYYGCLRVTLENGEVWMVAVLGPRHFVSDLIGPE